MNLYFSLGYFAIDSDCGSCLVVLACCGALVCCHVSFAGAVAILCFGWWFVQMFVVLLLQQVGVSLMIVLVGWGW